MINLGRNRVDCQQEREAHMVVQAHNVQSGLQVYKKKKKKKKKRPAMIILGRKRVACQQERERHLIEQERET